jgi:hypothetical protein
MKRALLLALTALLLLVVSACNGASEDAAAEAEADKGQEVSEHAIPVENAFKYTHVDGHKEEREITAFVLFEYEQLKTVKYQVAYIACTCRGPEVNYWTVAYVELNKEDGSVEFISYDEDSTGHYTAGMYGDSYESWDGTPVKKLFDTFIQDEIVGKTQEQINGYEAMHGKVDTYTGATVTPNNAMRMLQGLFDYHNRKYS